jgi:hypothetical protein
LANSVVCVFAMILMRLSIVDQSAYLLLGALSITAKF